MVAMRCYHVSSCSERRSAQVSDLYLTQPLLCELLLGLLLLMCGEGATSAACCVAAAAKVEHHICVGGIQGDAHVEDGGVFLIILFSQSIVDTIYSILQSVAQHLDWLQSLPVGFSLTWFGKCHVSRKGGRAGFHMDS